MGAAGIDDGGGVGHVGDVDAVKATSDGRRADGSGALAGSAVSSIRQGGRDAMIRMFMASAMFLLGAACHEEDLDLTPEDGRTEGADAEGDVGTDDVVVPDGEADEDAVLPDLPDGDDQAEADADAASEDGATGPAASVTDETWYEGSVSCSTPSIAATSPFVGVVVITLSQIPADEIQGTCTGHWVANESEMIAGPDILIILDGPMGSTCRTACWDFEITITGVPPGTYSVSLVGMSLSATVEVLWPPD